MFIREINLTNVGPIQALKIAPRFSHAGDPVPLALVGQNGAGKSLALSLILDALTEARRRSFRKIPEVSETDYLRLSSKNYVRHGANYSHAHVKISDGTHELKYDELVSRVDIASFQTSAPPELLALPGIVGNNEFEAGGFYKYLTLPDVAHEAIRRSSITYFPYFRYEKPYWLSTSANVDFIAQENLYGIARYNPVRTNVIEETKRWILNLALDREIYEKKLIPIPVNPPLNPNLNLPNMFIGYSGPNDKVLSLINEVILAMLKAGDPTFTAGRIGIGRKGNRVLSISGTRQGHPEEVIVPQIDQLSSGQLMSLGLATEIIRAYELVHGSVPDQLNAVSGIALIDEVDLHLHINFQKTLLPTLLRKFPRVQFIMTTHSPFFLLGMAELGAIDIVNLPIGNRITPEEFSEFEVGYDVFVKKNEQFRSRYQLLTE
ncbi:MAG: AAA family ATPase, partial [Fimbriimonadaceae bacterium]